MDYSYPFTIRHIYISPGHNYFGRPKDGPGAHETDDTDRARVHAGRGLVGDRYYGVPAHFEAQITFVAHEVIELVRNEFAQPALSSLVMRRNVVTEGINLNQLIGHAFELEFDDQRVRFQGTRACSPCAWMDAAIAPGALRFLKGRGGLRARILDDGSLQRGPAILHSEIALDNNLISEPVPRPRLP